MGMVGVVRRADRVQIVALDDEHVLEHDLRRQSAAQVRVMFVAVDALEHDAHPVDKDVAALALHGAEPHLLGNSLDQRALAVAQGEEQSVEVGRFGGPMERLGHLGFQRGLGFAIGGNRDVGGQRRGQNRVALGVEERGLEFEAGRGGRGVFHRGADAQDAVAIMRVQPGAHADVADVDRRRGAQRYVAEHAAEPPHVLVFEIAAHRPPHHADGDGVGAHADKGGDVELSGQAAACAVARALAVDPDVKSRIHALEAQDHLHPAPRLGDVKHAPIAAGGVLGGHARRVHREGVGHVGVVGIAIAVHLPVAGHGQRGPGRVVKGLGPEAGRRFGRRLGVEEPPVAVQQTAPGRESGAVGQSRGLGGEGDEGGSGGQTVALEDFQVLPIRCHG